MIHKTTFMRHSFRRFLDKRMVWVDQTKHPIVILVTGSLGKTTTKDAICAVLAKKYQLHRPDHSINSGVGLKMLYFGIERVGGINNMQLDDWVKTVYRVRKLSKNFPYDVIVWEVAENFIKDSLGTLRKIKPDYCVVTGIAHAHMEFLQTQARLLHNIQKIAETARVVLYNAEFPELHEAFPQQIAYNSTHQEDQQDPQLLSATRQNDGRLLLELSFRGERCVIPTQFIARQNIGAIMAAATLASKLEMGFDEIPSAIAEIQPSKGRMNLLQGSAGQFIIDDSYNSNLVSASAALDTLAEFRAEKIAVLGGMNEMGEEVADQHKQLAQKAAQVADKIICVGELAKKYILPELQAGNYRQVIAFDHSIEAGQYLKQHASDNQIILFKGSGSDIYLEEAIRAILEPGQYGQLVRASQSYHHAKGKHFENNH